MTAPLPMTTGRWIALAVGLPVVLAFIGWAGLTEVALAGQASYPVRLAVPVHGSTVSLSAGAGDLHMTQGAGSQLRLTGTAHYSLIRSTVTWQAGPSGVTVSSQCHFVTGVCSFDYQAILPTGKRAVISTGSGNISGAALAGPKLTFATGSGDIAVTGLAGPGVAASTGSGDIALTFTKVPAHVRVSTGSGNVTLVLPPGRTLYRVSAHTDSGNRAVNLPTSSASQHTITVTAGSGDISIRN